ncbi:MAG TPA: hypothetical protein VEF76_11335 [Patescibacteria group bacterium]|nr:hypothetical protein [Patescibacteria group bacterium]
MNFDPVEGVNYIFDRYAFMNQILEDGKQALRLSETSTREEMTRAFTIARGMYHPDRQARTGDEMKKKAEEKTRLIADCERVLLTPEMKEFFDAKLAGFRENKPHLISDSGIAIISLQETVFDIASLLSDEITDTSDFEARAKALLQYDEKKVAQLKSLYDMMPDNAQVKSLYRDAVTSEYIYLGFLEDAAWAKVGYINRKEKDEGYMIRASDYTKRVDAALEKAAARDIDATIDGHTAVARIGMAKTPLLLDAAEGTEIPQAELMDPARAKSLSDKFKEIAHKNFALRAEYVREVAKRKEAALETLLTLTIIEPVGAEQKGQKDYDFYLANPPNEAGESRVLFRLELDTISGDAGIGESYGDVNLTAAQLAAQENLRAGFIITRNPEIPDIMVELGNASEQFLTKKIAAREAQASEKPTAKGPALKP